MKDFSIKLADSTRSTLAKLVCAFPQDLREDVLDVWLRQIRSDDAYQASPVVVRGGYQVQELLNAWDALYPESVFAYLPKQDGYNVSASPFRVNGEDVRVPYRLYFPDLDDGDLLSLNERQRAILCCIYTRNYDGFVRQKYLRQLMGAKDEWVLPYVLALVGEYVSEINEVIFQNIGQINVESVQKFMSENEAFTDQRRKCTEVYE